MSFKLPENVQETTTTAGIGNVILAGAVTGAFTFASQLSADDTMLYVIEDGVDLEAGYGIFQTSGGDQLVRTTVYFSTNGGAKVNWPASGTRNVFCGLNGTAIQSFLEPGASGLLVRTGTNTYARRTLQEEYGITIVDPDGVSANPSFRLSQAVLDRLAYLETEVGAPGDTGNYWSVTIPDNSLTALINVVGYTGTAWTMTRDTYVEPTYPGDFTEGHWSDEPNKTLLSTDSETWRFYQYLNGDISEILDSFGSSGILVEYNEVIIVDETPVITLFHANAIPGSTVVDITLTASGYNTPAGYIIKTTDAAPVASDTWSTLPALTFDTQAYDTYTLYAWVIDQVGKISEHAITSVITAAATGPTVNSFTATLNTNTLIASISANTAAHTHYMITENNDVAPLIGDGDWVVGTTVPDEHTIAAGWDTVPTDVVLRLWVKDATDVSSVEFVQTVRPTDTVPPTAITDFQLGIISSTSLQLFFTASTDDGSGMDRYDLIDAATSQVIRSDVSHNDTIDGLTPGQTYTWYLLAYDVHGNFTQSNTDAEVTSAVSFLVRHGSDQVDVATPTLITLSPETVLANSILLVNNNRFTTGGFHSAGVTYDDTDEFSGQMVQTDVDEITLTKQSGTSIYDTRWAWSLWEDTSGSEFVVRHRGSIALNGTTQNDTITVSGVTDVDKCIPFITGIGNDDVTNDARGSSVIAYLEDATTLRVHKGSNEDNVTVYVLLVEFIGLAWTVLHGDSGLVSADTGTITLKDGSDGTGTATDVSAWDEAVIFGYHKGDGATNNDQVCDLWPLFKSGTALDEVDWEFGSAHDSDGNNRQFVHVLANSGMTVTRYQGSRVSGESGEKVVDITSAGLTDLAEAILVGTFINDSDTTFYPRGWQNFGFNSLIEAFMWGSADNYTSDYELQVVKLPKASSAGATVAVTAFDIVTFNENTKTATISSTYSGSITHYIFINDSTIPPLLTDGGWVAIGGGIPTSYTTTDYDPESVYLYVKDATSVSAQFTPINLVPRDTNDPTAPATFSIGTATANTLTITFAAGSDAESGVARHDLMNTVDDSVRQLDVVNLDVISGLTPGVTYDWYIRVYDEHNNHADSSMDQLATISAVVGFQQEISADDLLVMEAENFHRRTTRNSESWVRDLITGGTSGTSMIQSTDSYYLFTYATISPQMTYDVNFTSIGLHYLFVRLYGIDANHNSIHVGIDGQEVITAGLVTIGTYNQWEWTAAIPITIATLGAHTVDVWKREPGCGVDRLVFSTDSAYDPSAVDGGLGPAESTDISGGADPSGGFFANGDANWLNKDEAIAGLEASSPIYVANGSTGVVIQGKKIIGSPVGRALIELPNCDTVIIENCFLDESSLWGIRSSLGTRNLLVRNNYIAETNRDFKLYNAHGVSLSDSGDTIDVLGNFFDFPSGGCLLYSANGMDHFHFKWNFCNGTIERNSRDNPNFIGFQYCDNVTNAEITDNNLYVDSTLHQGEDSFSMFRSGGTVASPVLLARNFQNGGNWENTTTWTWAFIITSDIGRGSTSYSSDVCKYIIAEDNVCVNGGGSPGITGGQFVVVRRNRCYQDKLMPAGENATSTTIWRQGDCPPGNMHSCMVENNIVSRWRLRNDVLERCTAFLPSTGNDDGTLLYTTSDDYLPGIDYPPNHGTLESGNVNPAGWNTNIWQHDPWDATNPDTGKPYGYDIFTRADHWEYAGINGDMT